MADRKLEQKLDEIFSLRVRLESADFSGYVSCITCLARLKWNEVDCGHWKRRGHHGTRWERDNAAAQCSTCNREKGGMTNAFEEALIDDLGEERVEEIKELAAKPACFSDEELKEKIKENKSILKNLSMVV